MAHFYRVVSNIIPKLERPLFFASELLNEKSKFKNCKQSPHRKERERERGEIIKLIQRRKNRKIKKESGKMNGSVIKWNGLVSLGNNVLHDCPRIN